MPREASRHGVPGERLDAKQVGKVAVTLLAALLSVFILVAFGYGWKNYRDLSGGLTTFKLNHLGVAPTDSNGKPVSVQKDGASQNILIVGLDTRQGLTAQQIEEYHTGSDISDSTDSIMVVHVPANGAKATLISIPREVYVDIPGYKKNLINAAYADGKDVGGTGTTKQREDEGFDLLVQTVENLTGLTINHFVAVGFSGFVTITDAIGGVTVDMCYAQDDRYSGFKISAGKHSLDGAQALAFVRQRHNIVNGQGDLTRVQRQRYFLAAAFKKIVSLGVLTSPSKISNLVSAIKNSIFVDTGFSLIDLADQMADLSAGNIIGHTIPTNGDVTTIEGQDGLVVDPTQVQQQIHTWLNPPASSSSAPPSSSSSTPSSGSSSSSSSGAVLSPGCIL